MATKLEKVNRAMRILGAKPVTQVNLDNETTEEARILNDVYDLVRDETLVEHPWNFALKRDTLAELGGTITGWTEEGNVANAWEAALTTTPAKVLFDGIEGTEQSSIVALTAEHYWYYDSSASKLYVYSTSDPDTAFTTVKAQIPEFGWENAFQVPDDSLRVIQMESDDSDFVIEGDRLFTNEATAKIQYIKAVTTEANFSTGYNLAFCYNLASEVAYPLTNSATLRDEMEKLATKNLRKAKAIDAQEGVGIFQDVDDWEAARE